MFIARGGHKTKRTAEVEERLRKALAEGRSSRAAEPNGVYARRAGLVGIIPMPPDDDEEEDDVGEMRGNNNNTLNGEGVARSDHERMTQQNGNAHI